MSIFAFKFIVKGDIFRRNFFYISFADPTFFLLSGRSGHKAHIYKVKMPNFMIKQWCTELS